MSRVKGAVAAGHRATAEAAADILRDGGNAFDAAIAGFWVGCVAEPVLASLGGGGHLLARVGDGRDLVFDFFAHTPKHKPKHKPQYTNNSDIDFRTVTVDFGAARQAFHIGLGACATPGAVRGMFAVHQHLATMPMPALARAAIQLARDGVRVNVFQSYLLDLVAPIYRTESAYPLFASASKPDALARDGDVLRNPQLADLLDALSREGDALFYRGEIAQRIVEQSRDGGCLTREDLRDYEVVQRDALTIAYRDHRLATNPPPSAGGMLIAFALALLESCDFENHTRDDATHAIAMAQALQILDSLPRGGESSLASLPPELLARYRREVQNRARATRGTTHISVIDAARNIAALTVTNGEGCGALLPRAGFMLNNMLGEEGVNPRGRDGWHPDQRMSSMMAPSILRDGAGATVALGSGGSNRIPGALVQVISNLVDFNLDPPAAIARARLHIEDGKLHREADFTADAARALARDFPGHRAFESTNMFFGGVHAAGVDDRDQLFAVGDARRDGVGIIVR